MLFNSFSWDTCNNCMGFNVIYYYSIRTNNSTRSNMNTFCYRYIGSTPNVIFNNYRPCSKFTCHAITTYHMVMVDDNNIIGEHTMISNRYLLCTGYRAIMIKKHIVANRQFSIIYRL